MNRNDAVRERQHFGRVVILPATYIGSPRYMNARYQDTMAIVRSHGKPDLFVTMTMNPNHVDVLAALLPRQAPSDRSDIIARVFKGMLDMMIKDIKDGIFGRMTAFIYSVEYQARGLPHAHILIFLAQEHRFITSDDIDRVVCAEIPQDNILQDLVLRFMCHGPCGPSYPGAPCMMNGQCSRHYPKDLSQITIWTTTMNHPVYKRQPVDSGAHPWFKSHVYDHGGGHANSQRVVNNAWIVPYNPFLLKKYQMHINVEMCNTAMASKYLFKYITKGPDRAMAKVDQDFEVAPQNGMECVDQDFEPAQDEIKNYEDLQSIGASEACWQTFMFETKHLCPNVQALPIHLENGQRVPFREGEEVLAAHAGPPQTALSMWFHYNRTAHDPSERPALYPDFPKQYVWNTSSKVWTKRKRNQAFQTIGRVYNVRPLMGELYYLRLLRHSNHSLRARSFSDLKIVQRGQPPIATYRDICLKLGILEDDGEWQQAMLEAVHMQFPWTIRQLFCTILEWCNPSDPKALFHTFKENMAEDYERLYNDRPGFSSNLKYTMLALDLERRLTDRNIALESYDYLITTEELRGMCAHFHRRQEEQQLSFQAEEIHYNSEEESAFFEENYAKLDQEQQVFVDRVLSSIENNSGKIFFLDAVAGAGKTFCENILLSCLRGQQRIAIGVATTTGMASTQLKNGRTAQSGLHLPVLTEENCTWHPAGQSQDAQRFRKAELFLWDEATMAHRHLIEAFGRGLRDIMNVDRPFGGKTILLAGNFRQTLPIVKHGSRAQIINATIKRSPLWNENIETHHFLVNRRLRLHGINPNAEHYAEWLLTVGDGTAATTSNGIYDDLITIPKDLLFHGSVDHLANWVYPNLESYNHLDGADWICQRAILTPKNEHVNFINNLMMDRFPGDGSDEIVAQSADTLTQEFENAGIPNEYLNTLNPPGFPPHRLGLKIGMPLILLRNLNPSQGLSNGTKLCLQRIHDHMVEFKIIGGDHDGDIVCLPRILLKPKDGDYPFQWTQRQFPVNTAFAITINNSQGQTLSHVAIYLPEPCFARGQLYTALSRVSQPSRQHSPHDSTLYHFPITQSNKKYCIHGDLRP